MKKLVVRALVIAGGIVAILLAGIYREVASSDSK